MPYAERILLLPCTGICHHKEAADRKGHAGPARWLAADPGTLSDTSHILLQALHQRVGVLPAALSQH